MPTAKVTSKARITIPKGVREDLGLKTGDRVDFRKSPGGGVRMEVRRTHLRDLAGLLHRKNRRSLSIREMDEAITRAHSKK